MCGIAGFWELGQVNKERSYLENVALDMATKISHRGPDSFGAWVEQESCVALSHRRLAIVDLSENGAQPMHSHSGQFCVVYNGEVYNFRELRAALEKYGSRFKGCSDTEVVLNAFDVWGIEDAVKRFTGMFAMAVWDKKLQELTLVRDRLGEKPLYYGLCGETFLFGSELKALASHPRWQATINRDSLTLFFRHNYIPEPFSIYKGIKKLMPGHMLRIGFSVNGNASEEMYSRGAVRLRKQEQCFWSMRDVAESGVRNRSTDSEDILIGNFSVLMQDVVKKQMISDVPLGALLSGGIDSSTIAALMQAVSNEPVKTFSIGFNEADHDEAKYAAAVAKHLGTDHHELYVTPQQTLDVIQYLPTLYDEPFADSSQIPTWLVSMLVRDQVTVCLSGDGGDELFGGYQRYAWMRSIWKGIGWMPPKMRRAAAGVLRAIPKGFWDAVLAPAKPFLGKYDAGKNIGHKVHRLASILSASDRVKLYQLLISHWQNPEQLVINGIEPRHLFDQNIEIGTLTETMMYLDTISYLPGDILTKVDRASMGTSLEVRVPFLDHRVVEFAWQLPEKLKVCQGQTKWLLRQLLARYVPDRLINRPKMGFGVPIEDWLRGPLREWAGDLLNPQLIREQDILRPELVTEKWHEHLSGQRNWSYHLWDVLMFQSWYRTHA